MGYLTHGGEGIGGIYGWAAEGLLCMRTEQPEESAYDREVGNEAPQKLYGPEVSICFVFPEIFLLQFTVNNIKYSHTQYIQYELLQ